MRMQFPRFYPILDIATVRRRGLEISGVADEMLDGGVRILQFRCKEFFSREIFDQLERTADLCRQAGAMLVVNDRADLARIACAGLHLGQEDLTPTDARRVTGDAAMIGYSTHNEQQFRDAVLQPVDYLAFGPVFGTSSKENPDPIVGADELRRLRSLTSRPLVAIGGITRENARSVLDAGADSVAVIGDLYPEDGDVKGRVREWLRVVA
jgi:thiamine-phosphate pyrophosphorylase